MQPQFVKFIMKVLEFGKFNGPIILTRVNW